jgi:hypothetical protein
MMQRVKWFKCEDGTFVQTSSVVLFALNKPECIAAMSKRMLIQLPTLNIIGFTGNEHMLKYFASLQGRTDDLTDGTKATVLFGYPYRVVDIATEHCSVRTWYAMEGNLSGNDINKFLDEVVANTNPNDDAHQWDEVIKVKP